MGDTEASAPVPPGLVSTHNSEPTCVQSPETEPPSEVQLGDKTQTRVVNNESLTGDAVDRPKFPAFSHARLKAIALSRGGANAVLISGWEEIDHDGDDFMTKVTFSAVSAHLGIHWDVEAAWKQAKQIDDDRAKREKTDDSLDGLRRVHEGDDQIHFTSYTSVFNVIMGAERRNHRLAVKLGFEKLQRDRGDGETGIDKRQISELVWSCKPRMLLLRPAFDIETDWKLMRKHKVKVVPKKKGRANFNVLPRQLSGKSNRSYVYPKDAEVAGDATPTEQKEVIQELVRWDSFEDWWKLRMGLTETNVPVIPEYFSYKLTELGYKKDQDATSGKKPRLWWELQRRIQLMVKMRQEWGNLQSTYGHAESIYGKIPVIGWVIDPDSSFSTRWDILQVIFLVYVTIFVPLRACFQTDVEVLSLMWFVDTIVDLYFIIDLLLNCFTAFDKFGIRETRHKQIVLHYLRTWFFFDLLACLPVQYIAMAVESNTDTESGKNLAIVKAIRLVRLSKMLRLTRIKRILAKYEDLMLVQQYQGVAVLTFAILFASHFLACFWYLIGTHDQEQSYNDFKRSEGFELVDSKVVDGWVLQEWGNVSTVPDTMADIPMSARYWSSMYYVFNALENGNTDAERMFGVLSFFVVVMIDGAVAGVLSAMMISMGGADREITDKLKQAKAWMKEQQIPHTEALVALQYLQQSYKSKAVHGRDGVLNSMPPPMKRTFTRHLYFQTLGTVPFFRNLSDQVLNAIGAVVKPMVAVRGQTIFQEGSIGSEMYIILSGELEILRGSLRLGFVSAGGFFGEVPILDDSANAETRARTVTAVTDCRLIYIEREAIHGCANLYPELALRLKQCSRVGRMMNKKGRFFKEAATISTVLHPHPRSKTTPNLTELMSPTQRSEGASGLSGFNSPDSASANPIVGSTELFQHQIKLAADIERNVHSEMTEMRGRVSGVESQIQAMSSSLDAKLSQVLSRLDSGK